jgi:hypothetical protein
MCFQCLENLSFQLWRKLSIRFSRDDLMAGSTPPKRIGSAKRQAEDGKKNECSPFHTDIPS